MKDVLVPIDGAGRIVLPKEVRVDLGIKSGDLLAVSVHGSLVTLAPRKAAAGFVRKGKALVFATHQGVTLDQDTVNAVLEEGREAGCSRAMGKPRPAKRD